MKIRVWHFFAAAVAIVIMVVIWQGSQRRYEDALPTASVNDPNLGSHGELPAHALEDFDLSDLRAIERNLIDKTVFCKRMFVYKARVDGHTQSPDETWIKKSGICRDFSVWLMAGAWEQYRIRMEEYILCYEPSGERHSVVVFNSTVFDPTAGDCYPVSDLTKHHYSVLFKNSMERCFINAMYYKPWNNGVAN